MLHIGLNMKNQKQMDSKTYAELVSNNLKLGISPEATLMRTIPSADLMERLQMPTFYDFAE